MWEGAVNIIARKHCVCQHELSNDASREGGGERRGREAYCRAVLCRTELHLPVSAIVYIAAKRRRLMSVPCKKKNGQRIYYHEQNKSAQLQR